jgi:hypothetical protein
LRKIQDGRILAALLLHVIRYQMSSVQMLHFLKIDAILKREALWYISKKCSSEYAERLNLTPQTFIVYP